MSVETSLFFWLILAAILVPFILELIADLLNRASMKKALPATFQGTINESKYATSQQYSIERSTFGLIQDVFGLIVLLAFWFTGGFAWFDQFIRAFGYGPIVNGVLFIGGLSVANAIISLPASLYSTFVIEEKYGFNKSTLATFFGDLAKGALLSVILGVPVIALILWLFSKMGDFAWLYVWGALTAITFIIQYVAPTWIMPLFNKFTPLEDGELREKLNTYAEKVDFPLTEIFVIDGSKRSTKSNAFFTGFGKNKRIALYDTLIENHSTDELIAVLAHEIGHYKMGHIKKMMVLSVLQSGLIFFILNICLQFNELSYAFGLDNHSIYSAIVFFGLLFSPISSIASIFFNYISRKHEFEADNWAKKTTNKADNLVNALLKLSEDNLSNLNPHPFYVFLNYSHPPVIERIRALEN